MSKIKPNQFLMDGHVITEHPILFSTEMVKANLEDRKTQTRRTKGLEVRNENPDEWTREGAKTTKLYPDFQSYDDQINWAPLFEFIKVSGQEENKSHFTRPRYNPGDLLYVRENWSRIEARIYFQADEAEDELKEEYSLDKIRWKPSIHLPKANSRIWAMVEDIQVERVQDISEEDAISEGCKQYEKETDWLTAKYGFELLWSSINGQDSWNSNPWVWVIKYRILSKTGRPSDEVIKSDLMEILPTSNFPLPTT